MSLKIADVRLKEWAKTRLNENEETIEDDIRYIKEWARKEPHLNILEDDLWILNVLRGCKHSLERTKRKIDALYTMKTMLPEIYNNRDPFRKKVEEILDLGMHIITDNKEDITAPHMYLVRYGVKELEKLNYDDIVKVSTLVTDVLLARSPEILIAGHYTVMDLKNLGPSQLNSNTPAMARKIGKLYVNAYAIRPQHLIFINASTIIEIIMAFLNPFLSEKMKKRVHIFSNVEDCFKIVPKVLFPVEYGGTAGTLAELTKKIKEKVIENRDFIAEFEKYGCDESKRAGKSKTYDEIFGIEGSFKKLNVD